MRKRVECNENDIHAGREGNFNEEWWIEMVVDGFGMDGAAAPSRWRNSCRFVTLFEES